MTAEGEDVMQKEHEFALLPDELEQLVTMGAFDTPPETQEELEASQVFLNDELVENCLYLREGTSGSVLCRKLGKRGTPVMDQITGKLGVIVKRGKVEVRKQVVANAA